MAQIVKYVAQEQLNPDAGGMPRPQISDAMGNAVQGIGGAISNVGAMLADRKEKQDNFKDENSYRKLQLNLGQQLNEQAENMAPDGDGFHDGYLANVYKPERDKFLSGVSQRNRAKFETLLNDDGVATTEWSIKAAETQHGQAKVWTKQQIDETTNQLGTAISQDMEGYDSYLKQGYELIDSAPNMTTPERMAERVKWERFAQVSYLNRLMEQNPEGVLKDLGADPRYLSPTTQFESLKKSLVTQESGGNANAISPKGAIGLMQVMPGTAIDIAKEINDPNFNPNWNAIQITEYLSNPTVNQRYGDYYLKKQIRTFASRGGLEAALVAYNGGPARAEAWIKSGFDDSILPAETRKYYKDVMSRLPGMKGTGTGDPKSVVLDFDRSGMKAIAGQSEDKLNPDLVQRVKTSFAGLGIDRVKVNSGARSQEDNDRVGGAKGSQHLHGNAMDINVSGYSTAERVQIIQMLSANGITGIGVGSNMIHADLGGRRAWGYSTGPSGGGSVPAWAKAAIDDHLAGKSQPSTRGVGGAARFSSLPYSDRQQFIQKADQEVTTRYNATTKASAVQRVELKTEMDNELASLRNTGTSTNRMDDTQVSTVLGEDDYVRWIADKRQAQRMFTARDGLSTASLNDMSDRLADYEPVPGSPTYADDVQVHAAVQKEIDKITKMRAERPEDAAMLFPDVKKAYADVQASMESGAPEPSEVQNFVKLMIDRQKEFNLKPGSEAPVPREWAMGIGQSLARIPELAGKNAPEVNAAITAQYMSLEKVFGDYTDEVILYALSEYRGVGTNTAELLTGYMQAISSGGDPLKLRPKESPAVDRDQVEGTTGYLWRKAKDFWSGTESEDAAPGDAGPPEQSAPPSPETIIRVIGALNGVDTPEEEADIVTRYGQAAVDAAKMRIGAAQQ